MGSRVCLSTFIMLTACNHRAEKLRINSIDGWINDVLGKGGLGFYGGNHASHLLEFFRGGQEKSVYFDD